MFIVAYNLLQVLGWKIIYFSWAQNWENLEVAFSQEEISVPQKKKLVKTFN